MTAALATLAFLAAAWLVLVATARTIEESGSKIAAALRGGPLVETIPEPTIAPLCLSPRHQAMQQRRAPVRPVLRAAA